MIRIFAALWLLAASAARADAVAYGDAKGVALKAPQGVACTAEGRVVLADSGNGRLLAYSLKDGALAAGGEIRFPELGTPVRLQIDSRGNLLSLDGRTRRIVRVGEDGKFGGFVTPRGVPPAAGYFPISFKLDAKDNLYILDAASARVVVLAPDGAFIRQIAEPARASFSDIAISSKGAVLAVDSTRGLVYSDGAMLAQLEDHASFASYIAVSASGRIVLVDNHGNGLVTLGADGAFLSRRSGTGWSAGLVYYPEQICIDAKDDVFVADRGNHRLQVFTP
jgi:hypothetical protein